MIEMLVDIDTGNSRLTPIQILIVYNNDGSIHAVDWRHAIMQQLDDIPEEREEEYISDEDCDYDPHKDVDTGPEDEYEPLEFDSEYTSDDETY